MVPYQWMFGIGNLLHSWKIRYEILVFFMMNFIFITPQTLLLLSGGGWFFFNLEIPRQVSVKEQLD